MRVKNSLSVLTALMLLSTLAACGGGRFKQCTGCRMADRQGGVYHRGAADSSPFSS